MLRFLACVYVIGGIFVGDVSASSSEDDLKQYFVNIAIKCMEDFPLSPKDMEDMQNNDFIKNNNVNCLFACALKKTGMMDDKGNLSVEGVRKVSEKYFLDNQGLLKKSDEFTDACKSVNDEPVSDGDKGCDRAALIYQCSIEKAPHFAIFSEN